MKKSFPLSEIMSHRGCYSREMIIDAAQGHQTITLDFIIDHPDMQLVHKGWFIANHTDLTPTQTTILAVNLARLAIDFYETTRNPSPTPRLALSNPEYIPQAQTVATFQTKYLAYAIFSAITRDPYDRIFSATNALQHAPKDWQIKTLEFFKKFLAPL